MTKKQKKGSFWDFTHASRQFYYIDFSMVCLICLGLGVLIHILSPSLGYILMSFAIFVVFMRAYNLYSDYQRKKEA